MNQSSHNAAFMCDSEGRVVAYGGRVGNRGGREGPYGLHHGLLRWAGHATPDGVEWGPPMTVMNLEKARSLNCAEGRSDWESCELDGKLSAVELELDLWSDEDLPRQTRRQVGPLGPKWTGIVGWRTV